jgi:cyclopropane fatty-acyl-phospholipid synthase-like methyltransferase
MQIDKSKGKNETEVSSDVYTREYFLHCRQGADEFVKSGGKELSAIHKRILDLAEPAEGKRILDIGCGCGELVIHSALRSAEVVGVDYSADAIALAKDAAEKILDDNLQSKAHFFLGDVSELPSEKFDSIILADVVEHLTDNQLNKLFSDIRNSLNNDGKVIIHTWPNRLHTEYTYPVARMLLSIIGIKKPKSPRKPHDEIMHINEQSPFSLKRRLISAGFMPTVWVEHIMPQNAGFFYRFFHSAPILKLFFADHIFAVAELKR